MLRDLRKLAADVADVAEAETAGARAAAEEEATEEAQLRRYRIAQRLSGEEVGGLTSSVAQHADEPGRFYSPTLTPAPPAQAFAPLDGRAEAPAAAHSGQGAMQPPARDGARRRSTGFLSWFN